MSMVKEISREFEFSAAHVLPGHEKCGRLHGHNYRGVVTIEGPVAENGMVYDFNLISKLIGEYDHRTILPMEPKAIPVAEDEFSQTVLKWNQYHFPLADIIIIGYLQTTAENIAKAICHDLVINGIESGYRVIKIRVELWENDRSSVVVEAEEDGA